MSNAATFDLEGKVAVVTGAVGLLGRHHCKALGDAGAKVVVCDRDQGACDDFACELRERGIDVLSAAADVTDERQVAGVCDRVLRAFDRVDVLVNNAAINDMVEAPTTALERSRLENYPVSLFRQSLDVGVTGTFLCARTIGATMARRGSGSIINIASTYGIVAPDQSLYRGADGEQRFYKSAAYPAAKGAVIALSRFLAAYWGPAGVRANAISPGGVENGQDTFFVESYARRTPLGRMGRKDDFAGALVFLASDASSYVTGANVVVDGGFTIW